MDTLEVLLRSISTKDDPQLTTFIGVGGDDRLRPLHRRWTIDYDHYIDEQQVRLRLHQLATSTLLPLRVGASSRNLVIYYLRRFLGCAINFLFVLS